MTARTCVICESSLPKKAHKYCSKKCRLESERRARRRTDPTVITPRPCTECGAEVDVTPSRPEKLVCSDECKKRRKRRLQLGRTGSSWNPDGVPKSCNVCSLTFLAVSSRNIYCSENCKRLSDDARRRRHAIQRAAGDGDRVCRTCNSNPLPYRRRVCDSCLVEGRKPAKRFAKYGMTSEDYEQMRVNQAHRCALCLKHESELPGAMVVDHCHDRGWVRGLLCQQCNSGLGFFGDSCDLLDAAKRYLTSQPSGFRHQRDGVAATQLLMFTPSNEQDAA